MQGAAESDREHLFWNVAVCWLTEDHVIRSVLWFPAKRGFSISWDCGLVVAFHEHPGTGLFYDTARRIAVSDGRLVVY